METLGITEMLELLSPVFPDRTQNTVHSILALPSDRAMALSRTGIYMQEHRGIWNNTRQEILLGVLGILLSRLLMFHLSIVIEYHTTGLLQSFTI